MVGHRPPVRRHLRPINNIEMKQVVDYGHGMTVSKFTRPQLERALEAIYGADKGLRDARPDDRVVMEQFILQLVG